MHYAEQLVAVLVLNDERFENQVSQREMNTYFLTDDEN